ncbi:glycosyl hydrolase [Streptomyces sp. NPDC001941]|uniref:glycoside hydrolase family 26 protein n=1 Tax=Streptomyces sp. NPDC001941 TaxID=3154659 RepID=UPI00331BA09D
MNSHLNRLSAVAAALLPLALLATACSGADGDTGAARPERASASASASASAPATTAQAPLVPAHGALLGHYYGAGTQAETDERIGRTPAVHLSYYDWSEDWANAPATRADLADGRVPLVNWEPFGVDFDALIDGDLDETVRERADAAKRLGKPFFLDFAAEMNEEEGWGGHDPEKYVAAYRHLHDVFESRGATNVVWVWCPNVTDSPDAPPAMAYYPGDRYVDWTGVDGYNWGTSEPGFAWQDFEERFADIYDRLAAKGKPVIIGETGSDEAGGSKAAWIDGVVPTLQERFPLVKALVWFDVDKERHWRIDSSAQSLAAYRRMAADPYLNP